MAHGDVHVDGIKENVKQYEKLKESGAKQLNLKIRFESNSDLKFKLSTSNARNYPCIRRRKIGGCRHIAHIVRNLISPTSDIATWQTLICLR